MLGVIQFSSFKCLIVASKPITPGTAEKYKLEKTKQIIKQTLKEMSYKKITNNVMTEIKLQ
jgi:hypothetical protein